MEEQQVDRSIKQGDLQREDAVEQAKIELKRAYVQLGFGQFDEALQSCSAAGDVLDDHYLPQTLRGAILSASGRHKEALKTLKDLRLRHPERALPHLYFAEACLLSGRRQQGERALDAATQCEKSSQERQMLEHLRQLWSQVDPDVVPPPLKPVR